MKSVLLLSYNPVPTDQYKTVEGSGLRIWNIARCLQKHGYDRLTIAVSDNFPQENSEYQGIRLQNFEIDGDYRTLLEDYDAVVVNAAIGLIPLKVLEAADSNTTIIIDALSPMYVENLTSSVSDEDDDEIKKHYFGNINSMNKALIRGDYILVGSDNQKHLYRGVIAGLGALMDYDDRRFIDLPAYVPSSKKPERIKKIGSSRVDILWFGGLYPWYDIKDLINAFTDKRLQKLATLTIVGGSNPFYAVDNMRFNGKYIEAVKEATRQGLIENNTISFKNWVDYEDRVDVFNDYDVAISINSQSLENVYSFRIGVADLIGHGLPLITNGGDYIGDSLVSKGAAFKINTSNVDRLTDSLISVLSSKKSIMKAKKKLNSELYDDLHIDKYIGGLINAIETEPNSDNRNNSSPYIYPYESSVNA